MKKWIGTCAFAAALAATAHAQDSTVTSRTQVKADDAKAITATGCLVPGLAPGAFAMRGDDHGARRRSDQQDADGDRRGSRRSARADRDAHAG